MSNRITKSLPVTTAWSPLLVVSLLLMASLTVAQTHEHQHPDLSRFQPRPTPPVRCSFHGEIKPESLLVRGLMEIEYTNRSPDSLGEIRFFTGLPIIDPHDTSASIEPPYFRLDSMLCYGVPLSDSELIIDDRTITAVLPRPIGEGERAFFIMTIQASLGASDTTDGISGVVYTGWYPKVAVYRDGRWYPPTEGVIDQAVPEFADFTVALKIDSAYSLVYPGELVNDKEHYGLLPPAHNDSIYVDIVNQHQQEYAGIKYQPVFESGYKRLFIRSNNDLDFSYVAGKRLIRDRAYIDSLTIEVCYPSELSDIWAGFVAADAARAVRSLEEKLGIFPYQNLRIAASNDAPTGVDSRQLIVLPSNVTDTLLLHTMLEAQVSQCWSTPVPPDSSNSSGVSPAPSLLKDNGE